MDSGNIGRGAAAAGTHRAHELRNDNDVNRTADSSSSSSSRAASSDTPLHKAGTPHRKASEGERLQFLTNLRTQIADATASLNFRSLSRAMKTLRSYAAMHEPCKPGDAIDLQVKGADREFKVLLQLAGVKSDPCGLADRSLVDLKDILDAIGVLARPDDSRIFTREGLHGPLSILAGLLAPNITLQKMRAAPPGPVLSAVNFARRCPGMGIKLAAQVRTQIASDFIGYANSERIANALTLKHVDKCCVQLQTAMQMPDLQSAEVRQAIGDVLRELSRCHAFMRMSGSEQVGVTPHPAIVAVCAFNISSCVLTALECGVLNTTHEATPLVMLEKLKGVASRWTEGEIDRDPVRQATLQQLTTLEEILSQAREATDASVLEASEEPAVPAGDPADAKSGPDAAPAASQAKGKAARRKADKAAVAGGEASQSKAADDELRQWIDELAAASRPELKRKINVKGGLAKLLEHPADSPCALEMLFARGSGKLLLEIAAHHAFRPQVTGVDKAKFLEALEGIVASGDGGETIARSAADLKAWLGNVGHWFADDPEVTAKIQACADLVEQASSADTTASRAARKITHGMPGVDEGALRLEEQYTSTMNGLMKLDMWEYEGQKKLFSTFDQHRKDELGERILHLMLPAADGGSVALRDHLPGCRRPADVGALVVKASGKTKPPADAQKLRLRPPTPVEEKAAEEALLAVRNDDGGRAAERARVLARRAGWLAPLTATSAFLGWSRASPVNVSVPIGVPMPKLEALRALNGWIGKSAKLLEGVDAPYEAAVAKNLRELEHYTQGQELAFLRYPSGGFEEHLESWKAVMQVVLTVAATTVLCVAVFRLGRSALAARESGPTAQRNPSAAAPDATPLTPSNVDPSAARRKAWLEWPSALKQEKTQLAEREAAVRESRRVQPDSLTQAEVWIGTTAWTTLIYASTHLSSLPLSSAGFLENSEHLYGIMGKLANAFRVMLNSMEARQLTSSTGYQDFTRALRTMTPMLEYLEADPAHTYILNLQFVELGGDSRLPLIEAGTALVAAAFVLYMYIHRADLYRAFAPRRN